MNPFSLLLVLAAAVPAAPHDAQQPDSASLIPRDSAVSRHRHGDHRGHKNRRGGRQRMSFDPSRLLARKDALALSAQQVAQLTALENDAKPRLTAAARQIKTERAAIAAGLSAAAPDTVQLKRHYEALQTAAGNAHWARVSTSLKARAVLTAEQRGKVRGWADLRGGRWHSKS